MTQVPNKEARGVTKPVPDNPASVAPAQPAEGSLTKVIEPGQVEATDDDFHSGRPTKFIPAVDFTGYPDGKTKTAYAKDVEDEAPSNYVKLLKKKGLTA